MARRRDAFPPDRGLQVRIAVAVLVQAALVAVMVGTLVVVVATVDSGWAIVFFFLCFLVIGLGASAHLGNRRKNVRLPTPEDEERVRAAVERLAVQADVSSPKVAVVGDRIALSWTTGTPWGTPTIHVTTELLDLLTDGALEAVVAHELAHVVHHDATVMTLLAAPGMWLLRGVRQTWAEGKDDWRGYLAAVLYGPLALPFGVLLGFTGRIVSRHRELGADRAAAVLTGSPAGVAAALLQVSGALGETAKADLRKVASRDPFHFVPVREARGVRRLWATHPPLRRRVAHLERMEGRLQEKSV